MVAGSSNRCPLVWTQSPQGHISRSHTRGTTVPSSSCRTSDIAPTVAARDRTYPLDDVVAATEFVESGQNVGNVVLLVR
jgi:hypothetical protein